MKAVVVILLGLCLLIIQEGILLSKFIKEQDDVFRHSIKEYKKSKITGILWKLPPSAKTPIDITFEYIGVFTFLIISPFLISVLTMMKILSNFLNVF